jgi:tRNA-dihydrouridine synthase 3
MDAKRRQDLFRGKVVLAPLTKGGNLPFRRLLVRLGATVTSSEMAMASKVARHARGEMALLRKAPEETCFGVQLVGRKPDQLARAAAAAEERGADFVDLNLGCPIDLFCRRGMGAALLRRPAKVQTLVTAMRDAVSIPLTVKIRLGWDEEKPTFLALGRAAEDGGADAVTLHGRSRQQRYKKASDWGAIGELSCSLSIPVIGNGDLLTWRDAAHRWEQSGCASVMVGRGALIKPWIFREIAERRDYLLRPSERLEILRAYRDLAIEHFGDDDHGLTRVADFLTWHLDFFNRYRPIASETFTPDEHPLIQTRLESPPLDEDSATQGLESLLYSTEESDRIELTGGLLKEWKEGNRASASGLPSSILGSP